MLFVRTSLRPSSIHGTGLFADVFIPKGQVIWRFVESCDYSLERAEFLALPREEAEEWVRFSYVSRFSGRYVRSGDDYIWLNHSHSPNVGTRPDADPPHIEGCDFALRDIRKGEELTFDYTWFWEDPCCHGELGRLPHDLDEVSRRKASVR